MELLLHYVWKHKIFPIRELFTNDGQPVEIISPGHHNHDAGPDFLEAKIKIGGMLWIGNVEIHERTSDWFRHHHDTDPAYDNIILHVASLIDMPLAYPNGVEIPQLELKVPDSIAENYDHLLRADAHPRCRHILADIPKLTRHSWLSALSTERLEMRTTQIMERWHRLERNWEDTLFVTVARNFGFGKNGDAFETWAHSIPMAAVGKHRDDSFQIEAIFFGQAGLLNDEAEEATADTQGIDYYRRLQREYRYLQQKFSLTPMDATLWKFLRMRPQNFPHVRIAQLAQLYYNRKLNLSRLLNADSIEELTFMLQTQVSDFWRTHYTFHSPTSAATDKRISRQTAQLVIINSVVPMLFAYGKYKSNETYCQRALDFLEKLKPERNHIITEWAAADILCDNAADSQALIQLTRQYCDRRDCLRCRFGHEYIRRTPGFLKEEENK